MIPKINYAGITDKELRQYFIKNREDKIALQVYLYRLSKRSEQKILTTFDDPDFDEKIKAAICEQIERNK